MESVQQISEGRRGEERIYSTMSEKTIMTNIPKTTIPLAVQTRIASRTTIFMADQTAGAYPTNLLKYIRFSRAWLEMEFLPVKRFLALLIYIRLPPERQKFITDPVTVCFKLEADLLCQVVALIVTIYI